MLEIKKKSWIFLLWSTVAATISYVAGSIITSMMLSIFDFPIINTIIAGGVGGLFFGICLVKHYKIYKIILASLIAITIGFWSAFIIGEGVSALVSLISVNAGISNTYDIANILTIVFMGVICGAIFGSIIYGKKAIWIFSIISGLIALPFGILVGLFNSNNSIKTVFENLLKFVNNLDLNFLAIIIGLGIGIGLSIGVYNLLNNKNVDESRES